MLESLTEYLRSSIEELKRVSWPGKKKTTRLTIIVLAITVGVSAYLGLLDFALFRVISAAIGR